MFTDTKAFTSFAVKDLDRARSFYANTLGLRVSDETAMPGLIRLHIGGGQEVMVYEKPDHTPATYTILNFPVEDVDAAVDELGQRGVSFERYEGFQQDDKGIARDYGQAIAWFTDPSGNVLAVLQQT